jgi:hypothetical protein
MPRILALRQHNQIKPNHSLLRSISSIRIKRPAGSSSRDIVSTSRQDKEKGCLRLVSDHVTGLPVSHKTPMLLI